MKKVLISSFDMEVGGVERSLISLMKNFDYKSYEVDLILYRHQGVLMEFIPNSIKLLDEIDGYNTFGISITTLIKDRQYFMAFSRSLAKIISTGVKCVKRVDEIAYYQVQLMRKLSLLHLPRIKHRYDIAISYVWPHYLISDKVEADRKIAWIHTDYSTIYTNINMDLKMWDKFDYIISISDHTTSAFISKYPQLKDKIVLMENITSPDFVKEMANEEIVDMIGNENSFSIVTVARICFPKGIDNAVKALKMLHDKGMKYVKWYIVGYGPDEDKVRDLVGRLGLNDSFILLGKKSNPYPYIKKCNLYVQPSRYEGKSISITEAQILGKAVLVTNYPTARSQISDQIDGIITELSVEGLAKGIERLIKDEKLRAELERRTSNCNYSNNNQIEQLYKLMI